MIKVTKKDYLYSVLKKSILNGIYAEGELLISENEICDKYQVSREPTRRALKQLKEKGYIRSHQGKGYFVNPREFYLNTTITAISVESKGVKEVSVLEFNKIKNNSDLFHSEFIYAYKRIIKTTDNVIYEEGIVPVHVCPNFNQSHCQNSILHFFEETMQLTLTHDRKILESMLITPNHIINQYCPSPITHSIQTTHHVYAGDILIQISNQIKYDSKITLMSFE